MWRSDSHCTIETCRHSSLPYPTPSSPVREAGGGRRREGASIRQTTAALQGTFLRTRKWHLLWYTQPVLAEFGKPRWVPFSTVPSAWDLIR
jgi:hypothetical protein